MLRYEDGRCVIVIFPLRVYYTVLGRVTLIVSLVQDDSHVYVCMACTAHAQIAFLWEAILPDKFPILSHPEGYSMYVCKYVMYVFSLLECIYTPCMYGIVIYLDLFLSIGFFASLYAALPTLHC